jgi:hypothetical protein
MPRTETCCHCGEKFIPAAGKPGYNDECPMCLHEKTTPPVMQIPNETSPEATKRIQKAIKQFERSLIDVGWPEDKTHRRAESVIWSVVTTETNLGRKSKI